jgi:glycosyltransferase involved in cell wall biosynthesis
VSSSLPNTEGTTAPAVSVVIPTYNRSALLLNAIESVLRQTYTDYELIVIDDGSTDDTRERLQPYMERIRYFYQENKGASAAQNAGIQVARGKWVSILASDDTWLPTKLERQLEALAALGNEYGACFTDCNFIGGWTTCSTVFERAGLKTDAAFGPLSDPMKYIVEQYVLYVQTLLVLRSLVNEVGGFDDTLGLSEDRDLTFRLSFKTRFCFVSTLLVNIDRAPGISRLTDVLRKKNDQSYAWLELALRKMLAHPELADSETRQTIQDELITLYYGWTTLWIKGLNFKIAFENINKIRRLGQSYLKIFRILLYRAGRKLLRAGRQETS